MAYHEDIYEGRTRQPGKYRIRVTGYAYQSKESVVVDLSGISYRPGSAQPLLGFCSFLPTNPQPLRSSRGLTRTIC